MWIDIPDHVGITAEQAFHAMAIGRYGTRALSPARAARLTGMSRLQFQSLLADVGIPTAYDTSDLDSDIATLDER
jgi:predicted HTH domain antitoxin